MLQASVHQLPPEQTPTNDHSDHLAQNFYRNLCTRILCARLEQQEVMVCCWVARGWAGPAPSDGIHRLAEGGDAIARPEMRRRHRVQPARKQQRAKNQHPFAWEVVGGWRGGRTAGERRCRAA